VSLIGGTFEDIGADALAGDSRQTSDRHDDG
jgi:hypothetical protein